MFLPHFDVLFDLLLNKRTAKWNLFVLYNNVTNNLIYFFFSLIFENFNISRNPAFAHFGEHEKNENTPLSNLTRTSLATYGRKTYSESRIKLRNLEILKEMLAKSSQFLSSEQPRVPKSSQGLC